MNPKKPNRLYRNYCLIIIAVGLIVLAYALAAVPEELRQPFFSWRDILFFSLLGLLLNSLLSRLPNLGPHRAMAFLAPLFFLGPALTVLLAAGVGLVVWSTCLIGPLRDKSPLCREKIPSHLAYLFGSAQTWLALILAGEIFYLLGGRLTQISVPFGLLPPLLAAICLFIMEMLLEEIGHTFQRGLPFFASLRNGLLRSLPIDASLAGLGLLLALLYQERETLFITAGGQVSRPLGIAFTVLIVLIPCWLLYYSYRLHLEMNHAYENTLRTLSSLVEARLSHRPLQGEEGFDNCASSRVEKYRQVAEYAVITAEQMGMRPMEVAQVRYAAYLLEVGKVGLPRDLLSRKELVSSRQRQAYSRHAEMGAQILEPVEFLRPVAQLIRYHQARFDGLGYPLGVQGKAIPLGSRILTAAIAFVELLRGEDSGSALAPEAALEKLKKDCGTRFDPKVVTALETAWHHGLGRRLEDCTLGAATYPTVYFPL